jgi:hypothetical protein
MNPNQEELRGILSPAEAEKVKKRLKWIRSPFLRRLYFHYNPFFQKHTGIVVKNFPGLTIAHIENGPTVGFATDDRYGCVWDSSLPPQVGDKVVVCAIFKGMKSDRLTGLFAWSL